LSDKPPSKRSFNMKFTACKASWCQTKRWHHLPYLTHIARLWVRHSYWGQKEYLIPTNIIVLDWYFNLSNKSNLVDRQSLTPQPTVRSFVCYTLWSNITEPHTDVAMPHGFSCLHCAIAVKYVATNCSFNIWV